MLQLVNISALFCWSTPDVSSFDMDPNVSMFYLKALTNVPFAIAWNFGFLTAGHVKKMKYLLICFAENTGINTYTVSELDKSS